MIDRAERVARQLDEVCNDLAETAAAVIREQQAEITRLKGQVLLQMRWKTEAQDALDDEYQRGYDAAMHDVEKA